MKMTRVATLAFAASVFLATGAYAASSQTDVVSAKATISNQAAPLNSITISWSHMLLDCGTFTPSTSAPPPLQLYTVGTVCGTVNITQGGADATAQISQSGAAQPIVVTANDVFAGNTANHVTLSNGGGGVPPLLGVNLELKYGDTPAAATPGAFGTFFTPGNSTSYFAIAGLLSTPIGYSDGANAFLSGAYLGSFTVVVSL